MKNDYRLPKAKQEGILMRLMAYLCGKINSFLMRIVNSCSFPKEDMRENHRRIMEIKARADQAEAAIERARALESAGLEFGNRARDIVDRQKNYIGELERLLNHREEILHSVAKCVVNGDVDGSVRALKKEGYILDYISNQRHLIENSTDELLPEERFNGDE